MPELLKIAGVQMDVELAEPKKNLQRMIAAMETTSAEGATLVVFPECALTGYCFESLQEALPFAETVPGNSTEQMAAACRRLGTFAVFGMLESDGDRLFNACVLVGPEGVIGNYRKIHLPYLGIDMFTTPGDRPFDVHQAGDMRVGMNICYDGAFPEAARVMALEGADLIVLPTNWPPGAECTADFVMNARAMENHIYYMAVNRVGTERGFRFIGKSKICDPYGYVLAEAQHENETILYAEIDLERARNKHLIRVPGKHEIHRFADRRPEMYGRIVEPVKK
jgi:predicted amidohydrolase